MRKTTLSYIILTISILLTAGYVAAQQSHPIGEIVTAPSGGTIWHSLNDGPGSQLNADFLDGHDTGYFWHSGNDGPGSGLNADLLDGHDNTFFTARDFWQPNGANIYFTGGQVGIGTNSPGAVLHVIGNSRIVGRLVVTESVTANEFLYSSDARLKTDVSGISSSLERLLQLEGVTFRWKGSGEPGIGLIAQDVEEVFPEIVSTDQNTGMKSVGYGNIVAPLIEAIKEQQSQIDELRQEIESLKSEC